MEAVEKDDEPKEGKMERLQRNWKFD